MHFLAALLAARNNVAQGYAAAAERETGPLRPSQAAHRQHLAELEWLLDRVDRHESNPFALPGTEVVVAHQLGLLLARTQPLLQAALANRAANHARSLLLDLNQVLRELRRMLTGEPASKFSRTLDQCVAQAESASTAGDCDEVAAICEQVFRSLHQVATLGGHPAAPLAAMESEE